MTWADISEPDQGKPRTVGTGVGAVATEFRAGRHRFRFPRPAVIMGILNVTPDSFSDGGRFLDVDRAVAHGLELVEEGAELLDVGGESTRPGSAGVDEAEEKRRVLPVLERLLDHVAVPISIDTMKPGVARAALEAGASVVNDVGANRADDTMWRIVAEHGAGYVCVHMRGRPETMQERPEYRDVERDVREFFVERLGRLTACGVRLDQVTLDVGLGFGKRVEHNLQLLAGLSGFTRLGRPLLIGASRKSFIGNLFGADVAGRLPGSLACASWAVQAGAQMVRVHDVKATMQAVRMTETLLGMRHGEHP